MVIITSMMNVEEIWVTISRRERDTNHGPNSGFDEKIIQMVGTNFLVMRYILE